MCIFIAKAVIKTILKSPKDLNATENLLTFLVNSTPWNRPYFSFLNPLKRLNFSINSGPFIEFFWQLRGQEFLWGVVCLYFKW